jgi:DNA mismatch repair protein MSH3
MTKSTHKHASSSQSQPTISTFFSPRPSPTKCSSKLQRSGSPIDLTHEDSDDDAPPKKKKKLHGALELPVRDAQVGPSQKSHAAYTAQWRFESPSPNKPQPEKRTRTASEEAARKKNHEAFKNRLLRENSTFVRKKPREPSESTMEVDSEDNPAPSDSDDSGRDSDSAFMSFQEMLSDKRGKGKVPAVRKKKVGGIGPSGQTWTPLEKQV